MSTEQAATDRQDSLRGAAIILHLRSKKKIPDYQAEEELSLVPYLDIMMNLVIFMLVTISSFMPLGILSIYPPHQSKDNAAGAQAPALLLTVAIGDSGFFIAGTGTILPVIPRKPDGDYDYAALTAKAIEIKKEFPKERTVNIVADQWTRYEILVKTMDALRTDGKQVLFDDVKLSPEAS